MTTPNNYLEIKNNIINIFNSHLESFPLSVQRHFAERMYRITEDKKYLPYIQKYCKKNLPKAIKYCKSINKKSDIKKFGLSEIQDLLKKSHSQRLIKRIQMYKKFPEFKFYQELVWYLDRFNEYNLKVFTNSKLYKKTLDILKKIDFQNYFNNNEIMVCDPVQSINLLFSLKNLKLITNFDEIITKTDRLIGKETTEDAFVNKLYFYTHILINESKFYQKFITTNKYQYIYTYFDQNIKNIIRLSNNDLITEIGVCYKLINSQNKLILKKIKERIYSELINNKFNILLKSNFQLNINKNLFQVEHRNILTVILFSDIKKLFSGPDISKYY